MNLSCGDSFYHSKIPEGQSLRKMNEDISFQESSARNKEMHLIKRDDQCISISVNQINNISDHNLKNMLKQSNSNEVGSALKSQNQSEKLPNLKKIVFDLKLKMLAQRLVNQTRSRMFLILSNYQYKLINDLSWFKYLQKSKKSKSSKIQKSDEKKYLYKVKKHHSLAAEMEEDKKPSKIKQFFKEALDCSKCMKSALNYIDKQFPVLYPNQLFKLIWDFISMIIILILIIQIPLYILFYEKLGIILNSVMINLSPIFIVIDTFINLNSGFYEKGLLINKRSSIFIQHWKNYSFNELIILVSYIIHILLKSQSEESWSRYLLCSFTFKIKNIVVQYNKSKEIFASRKYKQLPDLIRLILIILIASHFISCFWILLSQIEERNGVQQTWLNIRQINQSQWIIQYMEAYYFSIVTMATVGFGDALPITPTEKLFCVILMIISCGLFAYSMNTIGNILDNFNFEENEIQKKMQVINLYMSKKNINKQMQYAIREYLDYYWREASERDQESEQKIISQLSDTLRENLVIEANKIVLKNSPVFRKYFSNSLKQSIVSLIKEYRCTPEELICSEGNLDDCSIFFIEKGSVEIFIETQTNQQKPGYKSLVTLQQGQSFGELSFFTGMPRTVSVRSKEFATLLMIKRESFIELLQNYSEDLEQFCTIKDQLLLNNDYSCINLKCYSCESQQHLLYQCPFVHFKVNKDKILFLHNKSEVQQRNQIIRRHDRYNFFRKIEDYDLTQIAEQIFQENFEHQNIQQYLELYLIKYQHQVDSYETNQNEKSIKQINNDLENYEKISPNYLQDSLMKQIQNNQQQNIIDNNKSLKSIHEQECSQDFQSYQNKSLIYEDSQTYDEINDFVKSPVLFIKQSKSALVKMKSQLSPSSPNKKSLIKMMQINDDIHESIQEISLNYPNNSQLLLGEKISPVLKQKKINQQINVSYLDNKSLKHEQGTGKQFINGDEKRRSSKNDQNLSLIHQNFKQKSNQLKSTKQLISQINELLTQLNSAYEHKQEESNKIILENQIRSLKAVFVPSSHNKYSHRGEEKSNVYKQDNVANNFNQDLFGESLHDLDIMKNYEIYFPLNNMSYLLKFISLDKVTQKKIAMKNKIDNSQFKAINSSRDIGLDFKARGSIYKGKQNCIDSVAQKFQRELEDEQYQNTQFIKKSKFFMNEQNDDSFLSSFKKDFINQDSINNRSQNQDQKKNLTSLVNVFEKTQQDEEVSKDPSIANQSFTNNSLNLVSVTQQPTSKNIQKNNSNLDTSFNQLNQETSNTRMQQIRNQNQNYVFDLTSVKKSPQLQNQNESYNIQENSPGNPINYINNNNILNQIKLKNDNEFEVSFVDLNK